MKKYSQLQQIISILITFIFLTEITGCSTARAVQTSELTSADKYIIHAKKTTYPVDNTLISDGMLSCKLDFTTSNNKSPKTHIYLSSDSALRFNNENIYFPVTCIAKIERQVPDPEKTKRLTAALIAAACIGLSVGLIVIGVGMVDNWIKKIPPPQPLPNSSTGLCTNW